MLPLILRVLSGAMSRIRNIWFRMLGVRLGGYVWMRRISIPRGWNEIFLGEGVALDDGVVLLCSGDANPDKIRVGRNTYVNRYTIIDASERIVIGENCMIGPHCYITDHDHAHVPGELVRDQPLVGRPVQIGDDVWIGVGVVILKGVSVGNGAIIGAGSVVTKSIEAGAKCFGVPAQASGVRAPQK